MMLMHSTELKSMGYIYIYYQESISKTKQAGEGVLGVMLFM